MELSQIPSAFQSRLRLTVIAALLSGPQNFRALQDLTQATPGNLGKQLELLETEGYLQSRKAFVGKRPNTTYTLLPFGREQFTQYVALLASILQEAAPAQDPQDDTLTDPLPRLTPPPGAAIQPAPGRGELGSPEAVKKDFF